PPHLPSFPTRRSSDLLSVAFNIGRLVGPIVGGAIYVGAGRSVVFAIDAATYVVGALTIASLRMPFRTTDSDDERADEARRGFLRSEEHTSELQSLTNL